MKQALVGLLAETSIHVGAGQQSGFVDLPVIREQTTMVPYIPASSLKGALREKLNQDLQDKNEEEEKINAQLDLYFGNKNQAGSIGITDGRLLLLPFRSLNQPYYLVTCPFLLQRFSRDLQFAGGTKLKWVEQLKEMARPIMAKKEPFIYLEEFYYEPQANPQLIQQLIQAISPLIAHEEIQSQLTQQLVILPDREFRYFAEFSLPIQTRNFLDRKNKQSSNLWTEESLPPDTLLYALLLQRPGKNTDDLAQLLQHLQQDPYIQIGGNETVGQGWMITSIRTRGESI